MKARHTLPFIIGGTIAATALMAGAYTFRQYKVSPETLMHIPSVPDSLEKENPFKPEKLLGARHLEPSELRALGWTTLTTDSAGNLTLVTPKNAASLRTAATRLRPERFTKGKLVLSSTSRAAVKVNGETKITKTTADSVRTDAEARIEMIPENTYDITVDILGMPEDASAPDFKLEFVPDAEFADIPVHGSPDLKSRVLPLTTMKGERVYRTALSPDGKYLLTYRNEAISEGVSRRRAVLTETASGKSLSEDVNVSAGWMPRGSSLYYTSKRGEVYDVYKMDVPSMRTSVIARGVSNASVRFSPDGKYLFYDDVVEAAKQTGKMKRYALPDDRIPGNGDRSYIVRYDLENKIAQPLTYGGGSTAILDFTRDGSKMLYMSMRQNPGKYPFYFINLMQMDMKTLAQDTIFNSKPGFINNAIYSPDGRSLFITGGPDAFGKAGANYGDFEIGNDFDRQGYIYDIATGNVRAMTRDFDPSLEESLWNAVDGMIYFRGETGFDNFIYRLDPKSGKITKLDTGIPYVAGFSIGDNEARVLSYNGGDFTKDGEAWLLDLKSGRNTLVEAPLAGMLSDVEFGKMEQWKFTAKDGTVVDGYFCLPPEFDASKKYPLIVYYYGGTSPSNASMRHLYAPQVFASRDYVVYVLNPSGTTGYGQEYAARHVNAWGKWTADEIIEGTKKFCDEHPYVDRKKIGCLGASYGGFMTQYLQTKTDIFAAAVSHAGISNVTSYWGEGYWGYSYNSVAAARHYPWSDPELFTKQGSLFNADKIHTPLLLLHGTVDTNVPIGESIQLFNALKILNREVEFITVENENHVISGFDNKQIWQNTIMAWFAKWLQDDPKWWNELYGK